MSGLVSLGTMRPRRQRGGPNSACARLSQDGQAVRGDAGVVRSRTSIAVLAVGHACVDVYQGAVAALVPFFAAERAYTYAAASGIVLAASLLSSVAQPLFGALTDRWAMPWLLPVSTMLAGVGIALSGVSGSYGLTLAFVAIAGTGVAG